MSLVFGASSVPLGTPASRVRSPEGGETVKSIQCFVLSDVKRVGRDKTQGLFHPPTLLAGVGIFFFDTSLSY